MKLEGEQVLFRVLLSSGEKRRVIFPLYRYIVRRAIEFNIAGMTVLEASCGYLGTGKIHYDGWFRFFRHPVICVELVDEPDRIVRFVDSCGRFWKNVFTTVERARVAVYRSKSGGDVAEDIMSGHHVVIDTTELSRKGEVLIDEPMERVMARIFIRESDKDVADEQCLYRFIVEEARRGELDIAVAFRGMAGFGKSARLASAKSLVMSGDVPVVVELVGTQEKVNAMLRVLDRQVRHGLITLERVFLHKPG